ncbi:V-type proton ATPase subunit C [Sesamum angolense]|uniref:V-type proton ATPase subunit C n=1 Tax=Sesamum angolense TaxID=2727404 RepID=A0AAE1WLW4_9LAMI|nr:V-type proton ATPase subunit C [Sesamum angolense]
MTLFGSTSIMFNPQLAIMATRYWVAALPLAKAPPPPPYGVVSKNPSPNKPSTHLSTDFIEGVSHKIRRQIEELERVSGVVSSSLTVDGVPVDSYLTRFMWDEAKYPTMSPLREIVDGIHVQIAKIEDDLKVRVAEYNNVRSQLNAINRKQAGSLAVRDLSNLVKPEDIISSEHLTTLLAIVPKYSQKDWLSSYETLTTYVVPDPPRSYMRTMNMHFILSHYSFEMLTILEPRHAKETSKIQIRCMKDKTELMPPDFILLVFSSWMHFCAVRVFSESILRYGLPPSFLSVVLSPPAKSEKKVRNILEGLCSSSNSIYWKTEDEGGMGGFAGDTDAHPYVSFTINLI